MDNGDRSLHSVYGAFKGFPKYSIFYKSDDGIIYNDDTLALLQDFPDNSVDLIVTSPPYWHLRDYGVKGQLGLEKTLQEYLDKIFAITGELKRILKPSGSMYWNHGDCYGGHNSRRSQGRAGYRGTREGVFTASGVKAKSLALQNYRLLIAMVDRQGWIIRNEIIWYKPNPVPSSAPDRYTVSHEPIFFLTKSNRVTLYLNTKTGEIRQNKPDKSKMKQSIDYHIEYSAPNQNKFNIRVRDAKKKKFLEGATDKEQKEYSDTKKRIISHWKALSYYFDMNKALEPYTAPMDRWGGDKLKPTGESQWDKGTGQETYRDRLMRPNPKGRHPRDVWKIATKPFPEAHFAVYPDEIPARAIKASCPKNGIVLDPFLGSGTTAIVAQKYGCRWIGIDLNPIYCKIAKKRITEAGQLRIKL